MLSQNIVLLALASLVATNLLVVLMLLRRRRQSERELRKTQGELRQERELSQVLRRTLSHDLANPLMAIRSYLTLLEDGKIKDEHLPRTLEKVNANVTAAFKFIQRARSIGLAQREASAMVSELIPVAEILAEIESQSAVLFRGKELQLEVKSELPLEFQVRAHRIALREHILPVALSNAAKYSQRGGVVKVVASLVNQSSTVAITVTDNGVGISKEEFERKLSSPRPGTEDEFGEGMGLILMGLFLRKFGADYQLTSEGSGQGSTLKLELRRVIGKF